MTLQSVLVTDTNIWVDLENGGVLVEVFQLPYQFLIPDFAISELLHPRWETLEVLGLRAHELPGEEVIELFQLRQVHKNLSIIDMSAYLLAKMLDATLLTGDWHISELAIASGLSVHGVLWLLDEMVHFKALTPTQAVTALKRMLKLGARLPAEECNIRLTRWSI
ncbi:MAG: type II toxin-antitoxin system VapC family toxin [Anaerolineae bacterium]|nr:type II toxin-antitoxin system VapC family toxin [Anaerolineae bacterium]